MTERTHDVAVLGLGGIGSAAFAELARRGIDVVGIDRWHPPHDRGSSHGQSRIFRVAYFEHPDYVPLARRSAELWKDLDERNQERIFVRTGGAWIGHESCEIVAGSLLAATQHGLPHELLEPDEVRRRWPALRAPEGSTCFFEAETGVICPEHAITAMLREGSSAGGSLCCGVEAVRFDHDDRTMVIETSGGRIRANRVVIAAGAWSEPLLDTPSVKLQVTRQLLGWTRPKDASLLEEGRMPVWGFDDEGDSFQYGFPICKGFCGPDGPKFARHWDGEPCDPDSVRRTIDAADEAALLEGLRERVPAAHGPLVHAGVCLYTLSRDRHFVIDTHPEDERVIMACGFSGHGFKFCPVVGEALADLALDGGTDHPIGFLSRSRLDSPDR
jgi:sarcosine oxidase